MRFRITFLLIGLFSFSLEGQEVSLSLISSSGTQVKRDQFQLQWSLGEVTISQTTNPSVQLNTGFHQNLSGSGSTPTSNTQQYEGYLVFPNPMHNFIQLEADFSGQIDYIFRDVIGHSILRGSFFETKRINTAMIPKGIYFLELRRNREYLSTTKLLKI